LLEGVLQPWLWDPLPAFILVVAASMALCGTVMMATPGQLLMGCRVGRAGDGQPLSRITALWRGFLLVLLGGTVGFPLITIFFDRDRHGIHDWLSFSMVRFEDESQISLGRWKEEIA